jgi:hypothetical protein
LSPPALFTIGYQASTVDRVMVALRQAGAVSSARGHDRVRGFLIGWQAM